MLRVSVSLLVIYIFALCTPFGSGPKGSDTVNAKVLSIDFHIGPVRDVKDLMLRSPKLRAVEIVDKSLSGHCKLVNTCAKDLRVVNQTNGISFGNCQNKLQLNFWQSYAEDKWMKSFDGYLCEYSVAFCEMYMAFGKPMILIAPTRYETGRHTREAWHKLNQNLRAISEKPWNTVAANNLYDVEYLKHFTGIDNVLHIPSQCLYVKTRYRPVRKEFLVGPSRLSKGAEELLFGIGGLYKHLEQSRVQGAPEFVPIRKLYQKYEFSDLAQHQGILVLPYQVSIMSLFEYYAMNIPMFVPSLDLLIEWQFEHLILDEISWNCVLSNCAHTSMIMAHRSSKHGYDPNDVLNPSALKHWLRYADFYQWPGIIYFDSWDDLINKAQTADLFSASEKMRSYSHHERMRTIELWQQILRKLESAATHTRLNSRRKRFEKHDWEEAVLNNFPSASNTVLQDC